MTKETIFNFQISLKVKVFFQINYWPPKPTKTKLKTCFRHASIGSSYYVTKIFINGTSWRENNPRKSDHQKDHWIYLGISHYDIIIPENIKIASHCLFKNNHKPWDLFNGPLQFQYINSIKLWAFIIKTLKRTSLLINKISVFK